MNDAISFAGDLANMEKLAINADWMPSTSNKHSMGYKAPTPSAPKPKPTRGAKFFNNPPSNGKGDDWAYSSQMTWRSISTHSTLEPSSLLRGLRNN